MIGTKDGYWYTVWETSTGKVFYEFYKDAERFDKGCCSMEQMEQRFQRVSNPQPQLALEFQR